MRGRFHQYLFTILFALLTILGLYSGQISGYTEPDTGYSSPSSLNIGKQSFVILNDVGVYDQYSISRPPYHKLRANLSENDSENDDNIETSSPNNLLFLFRDDFCHLISGFVSSFHNRQSAVSLASSEHLKPFSDDLYIQYRVIRL